MMNKTLAKPPLPTRQYMRNFRWIQRNINGLVTKYPNQWVAVHKGEIIAHGRTRGAVTSAVNLICDLADVPVYFVDDGTIILTH